MKHQDIKVIEQDESKLYSYLVELAKSELGPSSIDLFEQYLFHESEDIRSASIYALLFVLKIDNRKYRKLALKYVEDKNADFDLRQWSVSGLTQTYFGTDNVQLFQIFMKHLNDPEEDDDIKPVFLRGILGLHGLDSSEIFQKTGVFDKVDDTILKTFSPELNEINSLLDE